MARFSDGVLREVAGFGDGTLRGLPRHVLGAFRVEAVAVTAPPPPPSARDAESVRSVPPLPPLPPLPMAPSSSQLPPSPSPPLLRLLALRLKAQRVLLPLLLAVVAFQLILGQASSYALADREPPLSIAAQQLGDDAYSRELVASLAAGEGFEVVEVAAALSADEVFRGNRVQGLLVIPENFGERIEAGKSSPVVLYSAPGITNRDFASEQVSNTIMRLRARHDLTTALAQLGEPADLARDVPASDLLEVTYEGPILQSSPQTTAPVYGVSALLILLAYLHAALTAPTRQDKRLLTRGRRAFTRQTGASLLAVWLTWLVVIALYFAFMTALLSVGPEASSGVALDNATGAASDAVLGSAPDVALGSASGTASTPPAMLPPSSVLGFVALMLYVSTLATFLAQLFGRQAATWVFLPLFILNMTIGGGLWGAVAVSPLLAPLVPVAAVVTPGTPTLLGTATLLTATLVLLTALLITKQTKVAEAVR